MNRLLFIVYNFLVIPILYVFIRIAAFFDAKVARGVEGRKRIIEELIVNSTALDKNKKLVWFHSASLGEFEQAKPIIQELKKIRPINVLVTFFSPSGYENSRKYPYADLISYMPFDTYYYATKFIKIVRPDLAILMRYDIWPNHILGLKKFKIPIFLVDATMKGKTSRKLPLIKTFHKIIFSKITKILTVSAADLNGFKEFGCNEEQLKAVGDTRFDRVYQRSITAKEKNLIKEDLLKDKKVFVAGSTWEADEEIILPAFLKLAEYDKKVILIIAPHEPTLPHLEKLENDFSGKLSTIRFSFLNNYKDERVIIIDSIGILLTLYTYAHVSFVGGSYKQGIHNVLEAAVYGIPVLFGPKIENSQESQELAKRKGGIIIKSKQQAYRALRTLFTDENLRKRIGKISYDYVQENLGATNKILNEILKVL